LAALALSPTRRAWPLPAPPATQTSAVLVFDDPPAPPAPYTLSLHDALPISAVFEPALKANEKVTVTATDPAGNSNDKTDTVPDLDRKSTRQNSSHVSISYAVFCLKKKTKAARWPT